MSILNRPLTEQELADAGIEPAPIAHETFTQLFAVDRGELTILDPFAAAPATPAAPEAEETDEADEAAPPKPKRTWPAVALWVGTLGSTAGALIHFAGGGQ
jgi:hypothetical protein